MFKPTKEFHTARHRINFELGMLDFEFVQLSASAFSSRCAGRGEREDEVREMRNGGRLILPDPPTQASIAVEPGSEHCP